jgi:hypothetical protein
MTLIGASTAFVGATSGLVLNDLKRIIAFSTISQLGYYSNLIFILCLIITIFFILSETAFIDGFFYFNKFIYINCNISILAFGPFFMTTILHIPNKFDKKADPIEEIKENLSSMLSNFVKYNDFSYNGRSVLKKKYIYTFQGYIYGLILLIKSAMLVNQLICI